MEIDINQGKSKAFNIFLRFFQLGLSLVIAYHVVALIASQCHTQFMKFLQPVSYIFVILNLIAMVYVRCRQKFARPEFFVLYGLNIILCGVLIVMGIAGVGQANSCAESRVLSRFAFLHSFFTLIITIMIMFLPFAWIQRYSNTPGTIVFAILFLGFIFESSYQPFMLIIGLLCLIITLSSLLVNLVAFFKGTTTGIKKLIVGQWIAAIVLMLVCQVLAIITYMANSGKEGQVYNGSLAKALLVIFIPVNILDLLFWLWGLMTLTYENGDKIRDALMSKDNEEFHYPSNNQYEEVNQSGYGTIKN